MKFSFHLIATLVSVALCGIVHAAPAPVCDRTSGLCADIAARDTVDSMTVNELVTRAKKTKTTTKTKTSTAKVLTPAIKAAQTRRKEKVKGKKAANVKVQRGAAPSVEKNVKAFQKAKAGSAPPAKVNAQANKLRQKEKNRVATQAQKNHKAAKKGAWAKAANRGTTTNNLVAVQKAQGQKPDKKAAKKKGRDAVLHNKAPIIKGKVEAWYKDAKAKNKGGKRPDKKEQHKKEQSRALTQARKDRKTQRGKEWDAKKGTPGKKPAAKKVKQTKQEKQNVKDRFQAARQKYAQTQGMPKRGQTATVGTNKATGREVRQSVFNNYLHNKDPIGSQKMPKPFNNDAYSHTHADASLRGKRPLSPGGKAFKEFPAINNNPSGWTGTGPVGAMRTITYKEGGKRHAAVIGHDPSRGGNKDDHYVAQITRELEFTDMDDFE